MDFSVITKKIGRNVYLTDTTGWQSEVYSASIQPLRYKNKMYLDGTYTEIGKAKYDYFLYIGPPEHQLSKLETGSRIIDGDGRAYLIDHSEEVFYKEKPFYIWAVIRETNGVTK